MFDITPFLGGFNSVTSTASITTSPSLIIKPNPRRPMLYITAPVGADIGLFIDPVPLDPSKAQIIVPAGSTLAFTWILDGPMSTYGWLGSVTTGTSTAIITEITWHPENIGG